MKDKKNLDKSLESLAKSAFVVFAGIFLSKTFVYIYRIIIARKFGANVYGIFSLAIMLAGLLMLFANIGLTEGLSRYIPKFRGSGEKDKITYIFKKSISVLLITGVISFIILFGFSDFISERLFHEPQLVVFLKIFSFLVPLNLFFVLFLAVLRSYEKIGLYSLFSNIVLPLTQLILIFIFIFMGLNINSIILSYLGGFFVTLVFTFVICKKKIPELFKKEDKKAKYPGLFKEVLSYSWPLLISGVTWKLFSWADSFAIGYFKTADDVGLYNSAVPIAMLLTISSQMFMQLFFPLVTKSYFQGDKESVKQLSQQVGKWIFAINLPFAILLFFFPEKLIEILFGTPYIGAGNALRFLSVGFFMLSFFDISTRLISMKGKSKIILFDVSIMALFNLALNIALVPRYGITGAAAATTLSFTILSIILVVQSKAYVSIIPMRRKMLNVLIAGVISSIALFYLREIIVLNIFSLIALSALFILIYAVLLFVLKGLDRNDFLVIRKLMGRKNDPSLFNRN